MNKVWSLVLAGLVLLAPLQVSAFEFRAPDEAGNVSVGADQSPKDLYLAGGTVDVRANTAGDLVVAGGVLELSGTVEDDLIAGGGTVTLTGDVGDTVRIGGGNVRIDATIDGDLVVGAGTVVITSDAHIRGDLVIGAGTVTINGPVDGTIRAGVGNLTLTNTVGGDLLIADAESVTLESAAVVNGNFRYSATKEAAIADGAEVKGETEYTPFDPESYAPAVSGLAALGTAAGIMGFLGQIAMIALLALVMLGLARPLLADTIKHAYSSFWSSLGLGLAVLIVSPVVLLLLLLTLVGAMVAGAGFLIYGLLVVIAKALTAAVIGAGLYHWLGKEKEWPLSWQTIVVGALAAEVLMFIPFVGWLAAFVFFLMTLGALTLSLRSAKRP